MLESLYKKPSTHDRLRSGALGRHVDGFAQWLADAGFTAHSIRHTLRAASLLDDHLRRAHGDVSMLDEALLTRLDRTWRRRYSPTTTKAFSGGAAHFLEYLRHAGVLPRAEAVDVAPADIVDFRRWMTTHRGAQRSTVAVYEPVATKLLEHVDGDLARLTATRLRSFVLAEAATHGSAKAQTVVTATRMFVRFLVADGRCASPVLAAIPTIASWRRSSLPRYLAAADVERVIASCVVATPDGLRDRAVLLLLARLGLRAGDVAALHLAAIDWRGARLRVAGKSRREDWLPLPQDAGDALLAYLREARPRDARPFVFFTTRAPVVPISRWVVSTIVRRAIFRAGVKAPSHGAHVLRHSAATTMLRAGASLDEIGAVLRHASIETTHHYAKVDAGLLGEVAMPWPEQPPPCPEQGSLLAITQPWPEVA